LRKSCDPILPPARTEGASFSSLMAGVWDEGRLRYVGRVHTGYGAGVVADLVSRLKPLEMPRHAFELGNPPKKTRDINWARAELVAEIERAEFTAKGKIRQGSFKALRLDQSAEDLRAEGQSDKEI